MLSLSPANLFLRQGDSEMVPISGYQVGFSPQQLVTGSKTGHVLSLRHML
jgi:hypothetical protein